MLGATRASPVVPGCHATLLSIHHTCEKAAKRKYRCSLTTQLETRRKGQAEQQKYSQNYADAKTAVVEEILTRAQEAAREEVREDN